MMLDWDFYLFLKINQAQWPGGIETFLILIRNKAIWLPFYLFLILFFLWNYPFVQAISRILYFAAGIGMVDFLGNYAFKKVFQRIRPCKEEDLQGMVEIRVPCSSGFSFVSNHAANHMAIAVLLVAFIPGMTRHYKRILFTWAGLIGFAQIFVGVHYPSDVLGGFLLGGTLAYLYGKFIQRWVLSKANP
jgi:membrane-associated phospholipid phosphatase